MAAIGAAAAHTAIAGTGWSRLRPAATTTASNAASGAANSVGLRAAPGRIAAPGGHVGALSRPPREQRRQRRWRGPSALFDRGSETKKDEKKFITKEEEPDQYWQTPDEKEGRNPMTTPLPYIALLGLLTPFVILVLGFANNWIKIPVR